MSSRNREFRSPSPRRDSDRPRGSRDRDGYGNRDNREYRDGDSRRDDDRERSYHDDRSYQFSPSRGGGARGSSDPDPAHLRDQYAKRKEISNRACRDLYARSPSPCPVHELYGGLCNAKTPERRGSGKANDTEEDFSDDDEEESSSSSDFGPAPLERSYLETMDVDYGGALLAGEGQAMAAFVKDGKRIPRRGEIGISTDQIEKYENLGYVMSGSRHARMNAVRLRKENQVLSAEEKRLELIAKEEARKNQESSLIADLKSMINMKYDRRE